MIYNTAMESLGPSARKHKDWFDGNHTETLQLLEKKREDYKAHLDDPQSTAKKDALRSIRSTVQLYLRHMQDSWLSEKADEIQSFADRKDLKNSYNGSASMGGTRSSHARPPSSKETALW